MKDFKKKKYLVIKKTISEELTDFCYKYFLLKRQVARTLFDKNYISQFETLFGVWNDQQVPETYSHYADIVMEILLLKVHPLMRKVTDLKLTPNYSYARIYKKGDVLERHKDRFSCEISTTLNLGGDLWPIYLEPSGEKNKKGMKIILNPGDMLIYKGNELEHWREPFEGDHCAQVFLHYNNIETQGAEENLFDGRPHLGLPNDIKK
jgi:alkylated DNA repair dioxygenase AlkB